VIDRQRLRLRQDSYMVNHYVGLHITIVSVALGIAGVTAASLIAAEGLTINYHLLLGVLWLASLLATVAVFAGAVAGSFALPAQVPSIWDLFLPLLIAVAEFLLFAVLIPQVTDTRPEGIAVRFWFFCMAVFGLLAVAAIIRARVVFFRASYADDVEADIGWYVNRLRRDIAGASAVAAFGIIGGTFTAIYSNHAIWIAYCIAGLIAFVLVASIFAHGRTARYWRANLAEV